MYHCGKVTSALNQLTFGSGALAKEGLSCVFAWLNLFPASLHSFTILVSTKGRSFHVRIKSTGLRSRANNNPAPFIEPFLNGFASKLGRYPGGILISNQ